MGINHNGCLGPPNRMSGPYVGIPLQPPELIHPVPRFGKPREEEVDECRNPTSPGYLRHRAGSHGTPRDWLLFQLFPGAQEFRGLDLRSQGVKQVYSVPPVQDAIPQVDLGLHPTRGSNDVRRPPGGLPAHSHPDST